MTISYLTIIAAAIEARKQVKKFLAKPAPAMEQIEERDLEWQMLVDEFNKSLRGRMGLR